MNAVILYSKLAPFHFSRLEVAGRLWTERGARLTCIEIAGEQANYGWNRSRCVSSDFNYLTLFDGEYFSLSYLKLRRALTRALDEIRPDVVVINGWGHDESVAALGWCCRRDVPRVLISDSQMIDKTRHPWKEALKKSFVKRCQAGFAGGAPHVRYLDKLGLPAKFCVVGCDVVDNNLFAPAAINGRSQKNGDAPRPLRILSCLRFLEIKNISTVLNALARVRVPYQWTLAGDGPERKKIMRQIAKLDLQDRINLPGFVSYEALPSLYAEADAYLQPSLSEPWGLAVNEALASGLPAIVSKQCGCQEELIRDGVNGFTFDAESADDLVTVLERMWARREQWAEMGRASLDIIKFWSLNLFARNLWRACELATERITVADGCAPAVTRLYQFL